MKESMGVKDVWYSSVTIMRLYVNAGVLIKETGGLAQG